MPPKKKPTESASAAEEGEPSFSVESVASSAGSSSAGTVSSEYLEMILEANHRSMAALIAALPSAIAPSVPSTRPAQIKVPKWTAEETPFEYFTKYEKAMTHNGVDRGSWGQLLPVYLSGRAQASFAQVDPDSLDDYDAVKATMLESLGDTPASADRRWWTLSRFNGEEAGAFYLRVRQTGIRRLYGLVIREELSERMILSRFLSLLPPDCYNSVVAKQPKNGLEASKYVQEFEETRTFSERHQPWQTYTGYQNQPYNREQGSGVGSSVVSGGTGSGANQFQVQSTGSSQAGEREGGKQEQQYQGSRKPVTCYGCGAVGHIRPNCPNKVRRVKPQETCAGMSVVDGWLAGLAVSGLRVDTGADRTVVRRDFVPEAAFTGKSILIDTWRGSQTSRHKVARIAIKVGSVEELKEVAVVDTLDCPALLGDDLCVPLKLELMSRVMAQLKDVAKGREQVEADLIAPVPITRAQAKSEQVEADSIASVRIIRAHASSEQVEDDLIAPVPITRAQARIVQEMEKADELVSAQSDCTPLALSEVFDFHDSYFEEDPVPTPVEELGEEGVEIPLPDLVGVGSDSGKLVIEQQEDESVVQEQQADGFLEQVICVLIRRVRQDFILCRIMQSILLH